MLRNRHLAWLLLALSFTGCATRTSVISTDLTRQKGLYIVAYVDRADIRAQVEDQFVVDLAAQGITAHASRHDIADVKAARPADLVRAANARDVVAVLIVNRVAADGSDSIIRGPNQAAVDSADLRAYYTATRDELDTFGQDDPVFVEVNGFFVDGAKTRRFWTGTTWTFDTSSPGSTIRGLSSTIAAELARVRDELRSYDRPMTDEQ